MGDRLRIPSRRDLLGVALGAAASPLLGRLAGAEVDRDPPLLRNSRHQFTLLRGAKRVHDVELKDLNGRARRLSPVAGKVTLVNLWATWCEACRVELPIFERLQGTIGDRVTVTAVPTDTADRTKVRDFLESLNVRRLNVLLDPGRRLTSASADEAAPLTLYGMPITYLVDAGGATAGYIMGATDWASDDAQRLLAYYIAR